METRHPRAAGFSLIEALIATGIMLIIAVGIIPLFASSVLNNTRGADSTTATNFGRSEIETLQPMYFSTPQVAIVPGSTQLITNEWYTAGAVNQINDSSEGWHVGTAPTSGVVVPWTRTTTVTQYGIDALKDGKLDPLTEAEDGSTPDTNVQLKMIQVDLNSGKQGGILGNGERITLRMVRAY